jgi:hypothetical protein
MPAVEATGACCMAAPTIGPCATLHNSITCNDYHTLYPGVFRVCFCPNKFAVVTAISIIAAQTRLQRHSVRTAVAVSSKASSPLRRRPVGLVAQCEVCSGRQMSGQAPSHYGTVVMTTKRSSFCPLVTWKISATNVSRVFFFLSNLMLN